MPTTWQNFLLEHGGKLDEHQQVQFGDARESIAALATHSTLATLDHYGIIRVSGTDAKSFIQAQLSNDVNLLDDHHGQFSAYCNPKGRMLAQFLVIPYQSGFLLLLSHEILAKTLARLRMFVLRSAVTVEDRTDLMACLGLIGNAVATDLATKYPDLPQEDYATTQHEQNLFIKIPAPIPRYLVIAELDSARQLWTGLAGFKHASASVWLWTDIQAGLPSIWASTVEEFVPQMMNLELIGGVSFKKGCYPGQEIVARMHYLGKAKRRMFHLHADTDSLPPPGQDIYLAHGDGQSAGKVVIAQPAASSGVDLLAVLQLSHIKDSDLRLGESSGPTLQLQTLPYAIESEN